MSSLQACKQGFCTALFAGLLSTQALADPVLSTSATPSPAVQGSPVALNVLVAGALDLYGYQFSLSFNPALLQASSVTEGAFLGGTSFFGGGTIDNTAGKVSFIFDTLTGAGPGVNGAGVLATINFAATGVGSSALTFSDTLFLNSALVEVPVQIQNGNLQVVAVPEPAAYVLFALGLAGLAARRLHSAA